MVESRNFMILLLIYTRVGAREVGGGFITVVVVVIIISAAG